MSIEVKENSGVEQEVSLKKQGSWLLFAKILGFFFSTLLPLLIVRILSKEEVGIYQLVFQVIVNAVAIIPFGVSMSAYYFLGRESSNKASAVANILVFNFVVGGLACLLLNLFPGILGALLRDERLTAYAPKMGFVIWTWLFSSFLEVASVANREPKLSTIFIVAAQMTKTLLMAAAVLIFADVESFLYAALFQGVLQTIVLLVYLNFRFPSVWRAFDLGFFKEHLIYAIPFGAAAMLWILQSDIHRYFVGNSFTKEEYAVYAIGCFQLPLLTLMVESVTSVMIPRMSRLQAENDMRGMIELSTSAMQKLAFFLFPVIGFLALTAHVFIITLNTRKFEESVPLFLVNLMVWPFYIIVTDPISRAFEDLGRPMLFVRITFFVVMIAFLFYGIAHFSLLGMMMIVVVMAIMDRLVQAIVAFRRIGVSAKDLGLLSKVGKTAVASGIAFAATWLLYQLLYSPAYRLGSYSSNYLSFGKADVADLVAGLIILSVCGAAFGVVYLITAFRFGTVEEEVRQGLFKLAGKFRKLGGGAEVAPVGDRVSS